jgi:hypothetical protein
MKSLILIRCPVEITHINNSLCDIIIRNCKVVAYLPLMFRQIVKGPRDRYLSIGRVAFQTDILFLFCSKIVWVSKYGKSMLGSCSLLVCHTRGSLGRGGHRFSKYVLANSCFLALHICILTELLPIEKLHLLKIIIFTDNSVV